MADKWPLANGNWSNAANWNGGTKPVPGDDVYADGRTVTVDEDFDVATIRNTQRSGGTANGSFAFSGTRNCTCNVITGAANCVSFTGNLTINGNVTGGTSIPSAAIYATNSGTFLTINGNLTGGTGSLSGTNNCSALWIALSSGAPCTVTINGNIVGGGGSGGYGVYCQSTAGAYANITITGTVEGGMAASGIRFDKGIMVINGNVSGKNSNYAIQFQSSFTSLTINGNLSGGTTSGSVGLYSNTTNSGTVTVNGNIVAGSGSSAFGLQYATSGLNCPTTCIQAIASTAANAISNSSVSVIQVKNAVSASNGVQAVGGAFRFTNDPDISMYHWRGDTTFVTLTDVTQVAGLLPTAANVRQGTVYNAGGLTGTLAVPNPNQVAVGVATDNTVGTAVITAASLRSELGLASANLDTQLSGLANDIDNITVDNAAIALAVRSELGLTDSLDSAFSDIQSNISAVGIAVVARPTLAQIEASTVLSKESNATSNKEQILTAIGDIDVDSSAIATAVWAKLPGTPVDGSYGAILVRFWDMTELNSDDEPWFNSVALLQSPTWRLPARGRSSDPSSYPALRVYRTQTIHDTLYVYGPDGTTPVDLRGRTLQLVFERIDGTDVGVISSFDIIGADHNGLYFQYTSDITSVQGTRQWTLWDTDTTEVLLSGTLEIAYAATVD